MMIPVVDDGESIIRLKISGKRGETMLAELLFFDDFGGSGSLWGRFMMIDYLPSNWTKGKMIKYPFESIKKK